MLKIQYLGVLCQLHIQRYAKPANICLRLVTEDGEPMATATINPSFLLPEGVLAIKDYSENSGILAVLESAGVVERIGESIVLGFSEAHLCRLLVK